MDEEIERLIVSVRADTTGLARDVASMRETLDGGLAAGAERAGRSIETALLRAVRTGKLGFEDLRDVALSVLDSIATSAMQSGINALFGQSGGGIATALLGAVGLAGRATGGPVSPMRPYWVGERGPELFVPTSAGQVMPAATGQAREVRVGITVNAPSDSAPRALRQSSRQVARAVRAALARGD